MTRKPELLACMCQEMQRRKYSWSTIKSYTRWVTRFVVVHDMRHPRDMGRDVVLRFLNTLATERNVSASTQNQAQCAIVFLYRAVLRVEREWLDELVRAKRLQRLPLILKIKDRVTMLRESLIPPLKAHLDECVIQHEEDVAKGTDQVILPGALGLKKPKASLEWYWQWVFPATSRRVAIATRLCDSGPRSL